MQLRDLFCICFVLHSTIVSRFPKQFHRENREAINCFFKVDAHSMEFHRENIHRFISKQNYIAQMKAIDPVFKFIQRQKYACPNRAQKY
jgi:hypothetical protein